MSRQITELESVLQQFIVEHGKLLQYLETQQAAMKVCDLKKMDELAVVAEACRLRIVALDIRRKALVGHIAAALKIPGDVTLLKIAEAFPPRKEALLKLRAELKAVTEQVKTRSYVAGRVAGAVLGHLNTVVRLISGAVGKAGVYNKRGTPRVTSRVSSIEAVG